MSDVFSSFGVSPNEYEYDPATDTIRRKADTFDNRWNLPVQPQMDIVGNVPNVPTNVAPPNPNIYGLPVKFEKYIPELPDNRLVNDYQVNQGTDIGNKLFGTSGERFQTWPERMAVSGATAPGDAYAGRLPIESTTGYPGSIEPTFVQMEPRSIPKALGMGNFTVPSGESEIARVQDTAGMAGMGGIGMTPKGALGTVGSNAFYSNLERVIANSKVEKATPEQWSSYLRNQPRIKSEELEFELGNLPDRVISKKELEQHISENGVKLGEVWKGSPQEVEFVKAKEIARGPGQFDNVWEVIDRNGNGQRIHGARTEADAIRQANETYSVNNNSPKYSSYQLPGGDNYRELLLTVPEQSKLANERYIQFLDKMKEKYGDKPYGQMPLTEAESSYINNQINNKFGEGNENVYKSSHWDEPNVLAHIRMNDREIPGVGKSLHIEEIQSDWHQAGRKQGYGGKPLDVIEENGRFLVKDNDRLLGNFGSRAAADEKARNLVSAGVPNAPFKKSWDELSIKRALTEAVKGDYQSLSWTPGEAQAARYDLSKQIKELRVSKTHNSPYEITAIDHKGMAHEMTAHNETELANSVGKEMAKKIIDGKDSHQKFEGLDLKVGGEGMKAFYDTMLPNVANKLIKKMGGKVEYENINSNVKEPYQIGNKWATIDSFGKQHTFNTKEEAVKFGEQKIPIIRITPTMREKISKEGFPLFTAPVYVPVNSPPDFGERKLTPVPHNPFITPIDYQPEF